MTDKYTPDRKSILACAILAVSTPAAHNTLAQEQGLPERVIGMTARYSF